MGSIQIDDLDTFPQYTFKHSLLGEIVGLAREDDCVQFRGIPFASIAARFRQSHLLRSLPQQPFDARKPGPYCPQPLLPFPPYWKGPLPSSFPSLPESTQDELNCLNLSITVPRIVLERSSLEKLPVLFFIHGGAFVGGSQSIQLAGREIYDGTNLVRESISRAQPVILVTCNYRVGPLGFLASQQLAVFNKAHGEAVGNYGLHDQRQALEWCAKFIAGFGGDQDNITVQGTSAGGSSAHYLSIFPNRKFKRAILASGTLTGIGPMSMEYQQKHFDAYVSRHVGTINESGGNSVALLQSVPVHELVKPVSDQISHPLIDGDWIAGSTLEATNKIYANRTAPDLMIGACDFEADLTQLLLMDDFTSQTPSSDSKMRAKIYDLASSNGMIRSPDTFPDAHPSVTDAYNLTSASLCHPSSTMHAWADLLADVAFRIPPLHIASHHPAKVLLYEIRCKNPYRAWTWAFGRANHAVNDVFLFDVAPDLVEPELRQEHDGNVRQIREAWLGFCYGELPWKPFRAGEEGFGPMHVFEHGGLGRDGETLEEAMGESVANRWRAVLKAN
ncbi:Alpha/Beta hydrolase protein, partial [Paraphoma chrysanthemicola]